MDGPAWVASIARARRGPLRLGGDRRVRIADAEHRLELAEARRLEPRCRIEPVAEGEELERRHRLEDVDLGDQRLEDLEDAVQQVEGGVRVAGLERRLHPEQFVPERLEPELVDLVDDDEQQLIVLGSLRPLGPLDLEREQLRDLEVRRVGDGAAGHAADGTSPRMLSPVGGCG